AASGSRSVPFDPSFMEREGSWILGNQHVDRRSYLPAEIDFIDRSIRRRHNNVLTSVSRCKGCLKRQYTADWMHAKWRSWKIVERGGWFPIFGCAHQAAA